MSLYSKNNKYNTLETDINNMLSDSDSDDDEDDKKIVTNHKVIINDFNNTKLILGIEEWYYNNNDKARYYSFTFDIEIANGKKITNKNFKNKLNPFRNQEQEFIVEGFFVFKNLLTKTHVDFLLMDNDNLGKVIGLAEQSDYKIRMIKSIILLWE